MADLLPFTRLVEVGISPGDHAGPHDPAYDVAYHDCWKAVPALASIPLDDPHADTLALVAVCLHVAEVKP